MNNEKKWLVSHAQGPGRGAHGHRCSGCYSGALRSHPWSLRHLSRLQPGFHHDRRCGNGSRSLSLLRRLVRGPPQQVIGREDVAIIGYWWKALLWMIGIPLLILGILVSWCASVVDGFGQLAPGGYLSAFVGFLVCLAAFIVTSDWFHKRMR